MKFTQKCLEDWAKELLSGPENYALGSLLEAYAEQWAKDLDHWTDKHIVFDGVDYVGYDEAGLEECRCKTKSKARDALVIYAHENGL